jgi:sterol desaturase/sphingolipid hydroxylase (fatty acid hydroxylase superfamily)
VIETFLSFLIDGLAQFWAVTVSMIAKLWYQLKFVVSYPIIPTTRLYFLFLASSLMFAWFVFSKSGARFAGEPRAYLSAFFRFMFPKHIWKSTSAWLDVRYFLVHMTLWVSFYGSLSVAVTQWTANWSLNLIADPVGFEPIWTMQNLFVGGFVYMLVLMILADFVAFLIHYAQHKIPFLWEFHKVHHSATVMHPLTNFREHPVDNLVYNIINSALGGVLICFSIFLFGRQFDQPSILGWSILGFAFVFLAYNLRHSHIWLRWPGKLVYWFGCPAHHQVHHSYHPDHIDKNFAFMLPVWDVLFGTFCLPETNKDVKFGLGTGEESDYKSVLGLYVVPFKKLWSRRKRITN